jgi:hypothetical protein
LPAPGCEGNFPGVTGHDVRAQDAWPRPIRISIRKSKGEEGEQGTAGRQVGGRLGAPRARWDSLLQGSLYLAKIPVSRFLGGSVPEGTLVSQFPRFKGQSHKMRRGSPTAAIGCHSPKASVNGGPRTNCDCARVAGGDRERGDREAAELRRPPLIAVMNTTDSPPVSQRCAPVPTPSPHCFDHSLRECCWQALAESADHKTRPAADAPRSRQGEMRVPQPQALHK